MTDITVEVNDRYGGYIRSTKCQLTGFINVELCDGQSKVISNMVMLNPKKPDVIAWLKMVYQPIHLEILLGEEFNIK